MSVKIKRIASVAGGCVVAMVLSFLGVSAAIGSAGTGQNNVGPISDERVEAPEYKMNASGDTYGNASPHLFEEQWPELVEVLSDNGRLGFVYRDELAGPIPTTPDEAAAQSLQSREVRYLLVYEADGKTVIGRFPVGGTNSVGPTD